MNFVRYNYLALKYQSLPPSGYTYIMIRNFEVKNRLEMKKVQKSHYIKL